MPSARPVRAGAAVPTNHRGLDTPRAAAAGRAVAKATSRRRRRRRRRRRQRGGLAPLAVHPTLQRSVGPRCLHGLGGPRAATTSKSSSRTTLYIALSSRESLIAANTRSMGSLGASRPSASQRPNTHTKLLTTPRPAATHATPTRCSFHLKRCAACVRATRMPPANGCGHAREVAAMRSIGASADMGRPRAATASNSSSRTNPYRVYWSQEPGWLRARAPCVPQGKPPAREPAAGGNPRTQGCAPPHTPPPKPRETPAPTKELGTAARSCAPRKPHANGGVPARGEG